MICGLLHSGEDGVIGSYTLCYQLLRIPLLLTLRISLFLYEGRTCPFGGVKQSFTTERTRVAAVPSRNINTARSLPLAHEFMRVLCHENTVTFFSSPRQPRSQEWCLSLLSCKNVLPLSCLHMGCTTGPPFLPWAMSTLLLRHMSVWRFGSNQ